MDQPDNEFQALQTPRASERPVEARLTHSRITNMQYYRYQSSNKLILMFSSIRREDDTTIVTQLEMLSITVPAVHLMEEPGL